MEYDPKQAFDVALVACIDYGVSTSKVLNEEIAHLKERIATLEEANRSLRSTRPMVQKTSSST